MHHPSRFRKNSPPLNHKRHYRRVALGKAPLVQFPPQDCHAMADEEDCRLSGHGGESPKATWGGAPSFPRRGMALGAAFVYAVCLLVTLAALSGTEPRGTQLTAKPPGFSSAMGTITPGESGGENQRWSPLLAGYLGLASHEDSRQNDDEHKWLWPMDKDDYIGFAVTLFALILVAGAGREGGRSARTRLRREGRGHPLRGNAPRHGSLLRLSSFLCRLVAFPSLGTSIGGVLCPPPPGVPAPNIKLPGMGIHTSTLCTPLSPLCLFRYRHRRRLHPHPHLPHPAQLQAARGGAALQRHHLRRRARPLPAQLDQAPRAGGRQAGRELGPRAVHGAVHHLRRHPGDLP